MDNPPPNPPKGLRSPYRLSLATKKVTQAGGSQGQKWWPQMETLMGKWTQPFRNHQQEGPQTQLQNQPQNALNTAQLREEIIVLTD